MAKSIDLMKARNQNFFNKLHEHVIFTFNQSKIGYVVNNSDGDSTLSNLFEGLDVQGDENSIMRFRTSIESFGVDDTSFQNKILNLILGSKFDIQSKLNKVITDLLSDYKVKVYDNNIKLKVNNNKQVEIIIKSKFGTYNFEKLQTSIKFLVTPENVLIESFKVDTLRDDAHTINSFNHLISNKSYLLEKIKEIFSNLFGSYFKLENENHSDEIASHGEQLQSVEQLSAERSFVEQSSDCWSLDNEPTAENGNPSILPS